MSFLEEMNRPALEVGPVDCYPVKKGVPLPKARRKRGYQHWGASDKIRRTLLRMQPGDCMEAVLPKWSPYDIATSLGMTVRTERQRNGLLRIWRVK